MLNIAENEKARWESMSDAEKKRYLDMADYLRKEYDSENLTLADIDSAFAVGA